MTFTWPQPLYPLRSFLRSKGLESDSIKSSRQAAFLAQQLIGSRVSFPPQGSDMTKTLLAIQAAIPKSQPTEPKRVDGPATRKMSTTLFDMPTSPKKGVVKPGNSKPRPDYLTAFTPDAVVRGYHAFADGACVPNPGPGGWGFAVYKNGQEIASDCGGEAQATNNTMELTALLRAVEWACQHPAIPIVIWCDSQYAVNGANDWMHKWKAAGWQRKGDKADPKNRVVMNVEIWQAIDAALSSKQAKNIRICWVKGHAGHVGNERADELAEMGRTSVDGSLSQMAGEDLDAAYRQIMAG